MKVEGIPLPFPKWYEASLWLERDQRYTSLAVASHQVKIVYFPPDTPTTRRKEENSKQEEKLRNRAPLDFSFDCQTDLWTIALAKVYPIIVWKAYVRFGD